MNSTGAILVALIIAIVGPLVTYIVATKKLSGKINTSEAIDLWKESAAIRDEYRVRIKDSDVRISLLEQRVGLLEQDNNNLRRENIELSSTNRDYEERIKILQERLDQLETINKALVVQVEELRAELHTERENH